MSPDNEQLANFLVVYSRNHPVLQGLSPNPYFIERFLDRDPEFRKRALAIHANFQQQINDVHAQMERGELQCNYIRPNKKKCPNRNEPGHFFCGLHKPDQME